MTSLEANPDRPNVDDAALDGAATPMVEQYRRIKRAHPDGLLLFRLGDFYECFFEDAAVAAKALDITLTRRGRAGGDDIPMCGIPAHAADAYFARLIRKGFKVAICEQVEDPAAAKKRGAKAIVERAVIRIITPGTLTEDTLLDARAHNYLAAVARAEGVYALAWIDISTGDVAVAGIAPSAIATELARLEPGEILIPETLAVDPALAAGLAERAATLTPLAAGRFASDAGGRRLKAVYGVAALDGFAAFGRHHLAALGGLIDYVEHTQRGKLPALKPPQLVDDGAILAIDAATRRNLELTRTLVGERAGSLLAAIDRTRTNAGARRLAAELAAPLTDIAAIAARLDRVEALVAERDRRQSLRAALDRAPDLERALQRLALGRGGPRDLAAVRDALGAAAAIGRTLAPVTALRTLVEDLGDHAVLQARLAAALAPELPLLARDGGFVAVGFDDPLDRHRRLRDDSRKTIAELQARYAAETGIASLKIRHNNVLGYFIEATAVHAEKIGHRHGTFIHRQTLASAVRYSTAELSELAGKVGRAADEVLARELELFDGLVAAILSQHAALASAADALAALDVTAGLAELAVERGYTRPTVDRSLAFEIRGGRHPVVEAMLAQSHAAAFIANDCDLGEAQRLWLVTGPNMAGKSTFLRQNALIAILAQIGSFVPAAAARIGVVDRLFSRVGAADDLARGRSTFMVEMIETAAILNQASARSLVILDEIGRGTATFDGLSIAWAAIEHLHDVNRCRALFATHYHELTALAARLKSLACRTMRIKEWRGDVVFLHEVAPGAADRSYGIQVARLAGLPPAVLARAETVLATLEAGRERGAIADLADDLPLFAAAPKPAPVKPSAVAALLAELRVDDLTPRQALELLYRLKAAHDADEAR
ncbi:MAG: DNA mismatch repair protein MutS [Alphaproteobacteria bacterium]|nr:DNA mismatch repair protein MutS [Alphaproteobacteria bacterium]